jgi:hypothetical protein
MTKKKQPATQVQMLPMSAVEVNAGQLEGLPANPREIRDEKFEKLKANIQKYPELLEYRSLMVYPMPNGKHIIIGGNMRYRAMQELGYTEVPCVIIPAETPVEKLGAYTILDNNGFGKWDWDLLANEWSDFDLNSMGLDMNFMAFEQQPILAPPPTPATQTAQGATSFDGLLPPELSAQDLTPDDLPKIEGDETTLVERIIIVYPKDRAGELASKLGLAEINKILYNINELSL